MNKVYKCLEDIILWPDNTQCYRYELHEMQHMSDDFIVVPYGSLFYPDSTDFSRSGFNGITIHELDYDTVVKSRLAMINSFKESCYKSWLANKDV